MKNSGAIKKTNNDECYTERYAVEPILEFLMPWAIKFEAENSRKPVIWCPFDDETSEFVKVFKENSFIVEFSHIKNGQDFFKFEPKKWDIIISNPPFSDKRLFFERALGFGKPFALLMKVNWLDDAAPAELFYNKSLELLHFVKRMRFKNQEQAKISFKTIYFCHNFLPRGNIFRDFSHRAQQKLF